MPRRSNQKLKLMYLSKILLEQTDEQRGMTLAQILDELDKYGIQCGRKCLYDDIEALRVFGIDVQTKRDRYVRYYVRERSFDPAEIKLLFDMIFSCEVISQKKSDELVRKLSQVCYGSTNMPSDFLQPNDKKAALGDDTYKNINIICKAILQDKKISFKQFEWNSRKQRILLNNGELISVSPIRLEYVNGKYVMFAYDSIQKSVVEFAPQRLVNLSMTRQKREIEKNSNDDAIKTLSVANLRMKCDNALAGEVFERFGIDVTVLSNRDDHFEFVTKTDINESLFAWVFFQGGKAEILAPDDIRKKYVELLRQGEKTHEND